MLGFVGLSFRIVGHFQFAYICYQFKRLPAGQCLFLPIIRVEMHFTNKKKWLTRRAAAMNIWFFWQGGFQREEKKWIPKNALWRGATPPQNERRAAVANTHASGYVIIFVIISVNEVVMADRFKNRLQYLSNNRQHGHTGGPEHIERRPTPRYTI